MKICLKDYMCENFRFYVNETFRYNLFKIAINKNGTVRLAKSLDVSKSSVQYMKNGETKFLKWCILENLLKITRMPLKDLEKSVLAIKKGDDGNPTEIIFPIRESPELSLLIAKTMGDGHLEKVTRRFSYKNKENNSSRK